MTILVTGGAGYIGSHTCVELLNKGYDIVIMDSFENSNPNVLKRITEITGKQVKAYPIRLLDKASVREVFAKHNIEAVMHFAGYKAVGESVSFPLKYYRNNVHSTVILCEVMREYGVNKLVFSSSATVYGAVNQVPIDENTELKPVNPYGRTKQIIEGMLQDLYFSDQRWSIALLRYFNPIGAHTSGLIGEDPNGIPNNLLPYISQVAVGKLDKLHVFGNDYPTKDGTGIRDYIHVVDLAIGHLSALENVQSSTGINTFNLGTGRGYSVLEVIAAFEKASGRAIPYTIEARRSGDAAICYANCSKAKEQLGWQATRGIDAMCKDTWRWQSTNLNGYEEVTKRNKTNVSLIKNAGIF